jgi:hypothetical protein
VSARYLHSQPLIAARNFRCLALASFLCCPPLPLLPSSPHPIPSKPRSRLTTLFSIGLEDVKDPAKRTNARKEIAKVTPAFTALLSLCRQRTHAR